jgi:DNA-binding transcriptional MerR regulator
LHLEWGPGSKFLYSSEMNNGIKIGELAARCGVSRDTVRFYERLGVLPVPRRTASRHRLYDREAVLRLRFIRGAQRIGLTLEDISELLQLREVRGPEAGKRIARRLRARAEAIDHEIAKLRVYRKLLGKTAKLCEASSSRASSALERLFVSGKH